MDNRGQGLSTNAIILIILGLIVLAVLVLGFMLGWDKLFPFLKTDNVSTISSSCETACITSAKYDYCSSKRELKTTDLTLKDTTCYYLSEKELKYGIKNCASVKCSETVTLSECADGDLGKTSQILDSTTKTLVHTSCGI